MKKIFALIMATLIMAILAVPALGAPTNAGATDVKPKIVAGTWNLTVISPSISLPSIGYGIEWNTASTATKERKDLDTPYAQTGETLTFQVDASDGNGESDLMYDGSVKVYISKDKTINDNIDVNVSLGYLSTSVGGTNSDQLKTLTFRKDWIVADNFSKGKYYLLVRAYDACKQNASDTFEAGCIYLNPGTNISVYKNVVGGVNTTTNSLDSINFGNNPPGSVGVAALENIIAVKNMEVTNLTANEGAILDIFVKTDDLTSTNGGNGRILASSMKLDQNADGYSGSPDFAMDTIPKLGKDNLKYNTEWDFQLFLDYPDALPQGNYGGAFYITAAVE